MPITRPAPPLLIAAAEINDDCQVEVSLWTGTARATVVPLTPLEAHRLADEIHAAANLAEEYATNEVTA